MKYWIIRQFSTRIRQRIIDVKDYEKKTLGSPDNEGKKGQKHSKEIIKKKKEKKTGI